MYKYQRALECHKCGRWVENIGEDAIKVTCAYCVLKAVGMPKERKVIDLQVVQLVGIGWQSL